MRRSIWVQAGLAFAFLAFAKPAGAQIMAHRDSQGILVYTNADAPNGPPDKTMAPDGGRLARRRHPTERSRFEPLVRQAARQRHLDPRFVDAVIRAESDWNPRAISPKGAEGLMQLIPATSRRLGIQDAFDPAENIRAGAAYLADLLKHFGGDLRETLAAYYAGEGAVNQAGGVPASPAVTDYVREVLNFYFRSGSALQPAETGSNAIYETVDRKGRAVFTNQ
jgi:soluble lytic murein transglycosylase-like protein